MKTWPRVCPQAYHNEVNNQKEDYFNKHKFLHQAIHRKLIPYVLT